MHYIGMGAILVDLQPNWFAAIAMVALLVSIQIKILFSPALISTERKGLAKLRNFSRQGNI